MSQPKRHIITSALPYANGPLHIGHIAGAYLPADIYVRYLRLRGKDVLYVCGSDEHGAAITIQARKENTTPQEIVDKYHELNKKTFERFGMSFDIYHRTSSPLHHETAAEFFTTLNDKGVFERISSEQFYDQEFNQFLADRYVTGTCPKCGHDRAYGDQCEKCGSSLNPTDLINPISTLSGKPPVLKETSHWYLPMQKEEEWMKEWINTGKLEGKTHHDPSKWKKPVLGQCKSWLDGGLQSRAMTRDLDWGVKVPLENAEGKVLYVWLDAPIGYISATKQWALDNKANWEEWWKDENCELVHFIGKDNIVFHCIIFPIILKLHGGYNLPVNVPANEFLNLEGDKISTSRNHAVWLHEYLDDFSGKEDVLRYVLTSIAPEMKDSEFTWDDFQARNNNELVAIFGNFVNRALVLTGKYFDGKVPSGGKENAEDKAILEQCKAIPEKVGRAIEGFRFREALTEAMQLARIGNKYLADNEPWKVFKTDPDRVAQVMHTSLQIAAALAVVMKPFLPNTANQLATMLNLPATAWDKAGTMALLESGHTLGTTTLLFEKIEDEAMQAQKDKLNKNKPQKSNVMAAKAEIVFDDFTKVDIRTATILEAEKVPETDKLLKLKVDTGLDQRTVVSGIAEHYKAEEIIGKKVLILVNLAPRKLRGIMSQGMILMAEDADGKLCFVSPSEEVVNGSTVS
ncbi:MAG: methionine--tRNA ligase [Flavobacteriales bacterium]|nr:methionine--tRNA ligase [Flavobacteriales bacterium]